MESRHAIQIANLSKTYRQRNRTPVLAVQGINLSVPSGQLFGFLGPNGAGKTTTIKMICSLIEPTSGSVCILGNDVWRRRSFAVRHIGAVLEGTRNVHWSLSAWDNLLYFGHLKGMSGKRLSGRAEQLLHELNLWDRRGDLVRTFSRGMQQKVAIACALIADPPIVLLDEPTLGLDVQAARVVRDLVGRLAREQGKTVVLTTHQLDMAQELCDRVAIICKGRIIADHPIEELLDIFSTEYYQIRVEGTLSDQSAAGFDGLNLAQENSNTILTGPIADQDALYGILDRLRDAGHPLLAINKAEPDLEEIFLHLLDSNGDRGEA